MTNLSIMSNVDAQQLMDEIHWDDIQNRKSRSAAETKSEFEWQALKAIQVRCDGDLRALNEFKYDTISINTIERLAGFLNYDF